jgi:hypothetical protein
MLLTSPVTRAVNQYLADFNAYYGTSGTKLDDCLVCHMTSNGGARNSYGTDFELAKISNTYAGVTQALDAIASLDSDEGGLLNIEEIAALTWPGDCTDPVTEVCPGGGGEPPVDPGTVTEGPTLMGCYKWSRFPTERLALSIKRYGGLVTIRWIGH